VCYNGQCPYEKWGNPDTAGECAKPSMQGTPLAHCYEEPEEGEEDE